jgi:hypothetical protein
MAAGEPSAGVLTPKRIAPERLALVEQMYLAGKARSRITSEVCERYGCSARNARRYIEIVEKRLAALPKPPPEATAQRVEAMLLEAYELARDSKQRVAVSLGAGAGSRVEEFPQPNVGVMATIAGRLADLHGVGGEKPTSGPAAVVIELPASLARPREG